MAEYFSFLKLRTDEDKRKSLQFFALLCGGWVVLTLLRASFANRSRQQFSQHEDPTMAFIQSNRGYAPQNFNQMPSQQ